MNHHSGVLEAYQHHHSFGLDQKNTNEKRILFVILITILVMVLEVVAGYFFGSMALLADGLHMGSHAIALGISAFAYAYARKHANDPSFTLGTGKVHVFAGSAGAILLGGFASVILVESGSRMLQPRAIDFNMAILVSVIGLVVNIVCALILGKSHDHHSYSHSHSHQEDQVAPSRQSHALSSAYLHVLADALTSLLAIISLLVAKHTGLLWVDPLVGIVGAFLIARWSWKLLRTTSANLLDKRPSIALLESVRQAIQERSSDRVVDIHIWELGAGNLSLAVSIISKNPLTPDEYRSLIPSQINIVHSTIEVNVVGENAW
ncbi:MAG: CDF family Co(II)/Ni(II) efflux transporter DmeF [Gammaproteobacteria bacterium]|nr:CDF family Co(II)/Ni(II) efflux transporter DmeF [Gammaproteobacteria bacterium]